MPAYEAGLFDPPAPVARVALRAPGTGQPLQIAGIAMLIDSGADVTLLPAGPVRELGILGEGAYELEAFDGERRFAPAAHLELIFERRIFRGRYLLIDQSWGVLGRNVLNSMSLVHDGPRLEWREDRRQLG